MLNENIKNYRKSKGFSQETLAQELNVVRQTVSKWEKGLSVPDAEMLTKISEVLDVSVMTLLGGKEEELPEKTDNSAIANQLYILNNQFAKELYRRKKVRRTILIILLCVFILAPAICCFVFKSRTIESSRAEFSSVEVPSKIFNESEIDSAIDYVVNVFEYDLEHCYLKEVSYAGDDIVRKEMKYRDDTYKEGDIILIKTIFDTDNKAGSQGFNGNFTYTDWYWILERTASGHWTELDHGVL